MPAFQDAVIVPTIGLGVMQIQQLHQTGQTNVLEQTVILLNLIILPLFIWQALLFLIPLVAAGKLLIMLHQVKHLVKHTDRLFYILLNPLLPAIRFLQILLERVVLMLKLIILPLFIRQALLFLIPKVAAGKLLIMQVQVKHLVKNMDRLFKSILLATLLKLA